MNRFFYTSDKDTKTKTGIYIIKNNVSNKVYIGSAFHLSNRCSIHKHSLIKNKHHSKHLQNFYNKHPEAIFYFEVLEIVQNREDLKEREQYYLDLFKSYDGINGFNICQFAGSTMGRKSTPEAIAKMKATWVKMGGHPALGNIFENRRGVPLTEETKQKIREKLSGENSVNWGKKRSKEHMIGTTRTCCKPVDIIDEDGNILRTFYSAKEAKRILGTDSSSIKRVCCGQEKRVKGYRFQYSKLTYDEIMEMRKSNPI